MLGAGPVAPARRWVLLANSCAASERTCASCARLSRSSLSLDTSALSR
jgi:hypothetical protein